MQIVWGEKKYSMKLLLGSAEDGWLQHHAAGCATMLWRGRTWNCPAEALRDSNTELSIRTLGRLVTADQFNAMIIRDDGGNVVRMRDIGKAELLPENEKIAAAR
jgi:multidrug efflux pump